MGNASAVGDGGDERVFPANEIVCLFDIAVEVALSHSRYQTASYNIKCNTLKNSQKNKDNTLTKV